MEPTSFEVTSEHVKRRFDALERRIGFAATLGLVERNQIEEAAIGELDDSELTQYIEMLRDPEYDSVDDDEVAEIAVEMEIRQAFGQIDGYHLAEVTAAGILLVKQLDDPTSFRPSVRLHYDTVRDHYEKSISRIVGGFKNSAPEVQPITDEDRVIVAAALAKINQINHELLTESGE